MWTVLLFACSGDGQLEAPRPAAPVPERAVESHPPEPVEPYWVERSDLELDALLRSTCTNDQPVLLAFSAPWCGDCKRVRQLESQEPLKSELAQWSKVVVHVGRFDRHAPLREAFGVHSIAHWVALAPDCTKPIPSWERLAEGVFEPASGEPKTAADLAGWLQSARTK